MSTMPYPGMRTVKTAIAVVFVMSFYRMTMGAEFWMNGAILASIVAIICLQESVDKTLKEGAARILGTFLGGVAGAAMVATGLRDHHFVLFIIAAGICIVAVIYICNLMDKNSSVPISCVVFMMVVLNTSGVSPVFHAFVNVIDTMVGIGVAYGVNKLVYAPNPRRVLYKQRAASAQAGQMLENSEDEQQKES